jgi:hypothetical protein
MWLEKKTVKLAIRFTPIVGIKTLNNADFGGAQPGTVVLPSVEKE